VSRDFLYSPPCGEQALGVLVRDAPSRSGTHLREHLTEGVDALLVEAQRWRVGGVGTEQEAVAEILEQPEHLRIHLPAVRLDEVNIGRALGPIASVAAVVVRRNRVYARYYVSNSGK
jgi:hypothetical protein